MVNQNIIVKLRNQVTHIHTLKLFVRPIHSVIGKFRKFSFVIVKSVDLLYVRESGVKSPKSHHTQSEPIRPLRKMPTTNSEIESLTSASKAWHRQSSKQPRR